MGKSQQTNGYLLFKISQTDRPLATRKGSNKYHRTDVEEERAQSRRRLRGAIARGRVLQALPPSLLSVTAVPCEARPFRAVLERLFRNGHQSCLVPKTGQRGS